MADPQYMMIPGENAWLIGSLVGGKATWTRTTPSDESNDAGSSGRAAAEALMAAGYRGQPLLLGLPSSWCLSAVISIDGLDRSNRRRAMAFRLEEHLPLSAEQMVADYIRLDGDEALGICCDLAKLAGIVEVCEAAGIAIGPICPVALLAGGALAAEHDSADSLVLCDHTSVLDQPGYSFDVIELQSGKPCRWWWFADQPAAAQDQVAALRAEADRSIDVVAAGCDESTIDSQQTGDAISGRTLSDRSVTDLALGEASRVLAGRAAPWINLRREALAGSAAQRTIPMPMLAAAVGLLALLVSISIVGTWRGRAYQSMAQAADRQQVELFKAAFADQPVPPAGTIKRRLASEQRRLVDLGRGSSPGDGQHTAPGALDQLRLILTHLPADQRFRILDLDIKPELIRVDGEARSHLEAEQLAMALRDSNAYQVEPPNTDALDDKRVSFLFTGRVRPEALSWSHDSDSSRQVNDD